MVLHGNTTRQKHDSRHRTDRRRATATASATRDPHGASRPHGAILAALAPAGWPTARRGGRLTSHVSARPWTSGPCAAAETEQRAKQDAFALCGILGALEAFLPYYLLPGSLALAPWPNCFTPYWGAMRLLAALDDEDVEGGGGGGGEGRRGASGGTDSVPVTGGSGAAAEV